MKITAIHCGFFKLDGGAMFGIIPKRLWSKLNPPDENNLCTWALRCLLIETGDRKILVDCGLGDKQDAKWRTYFEPHGSQSLLTSLMEAGTSSEEITDVFLTHLHFDHCGGSTRIDEKGRIVPAFENATYWSNEIHWAWALAGNDREKASFLQENFVPLQKAGVIKFIDVQKDLIEWLPGLTVQYAYGHTEAMMALHIAAADRYFVYCADLMPSSFHLGMPYVMSYDIRPMTTLVEKEWLLSNAVERDWTLIFEHDPEAGFGTLMKDDKGRITLKEKRDKI